MVSLAPAISFIIPCYNNHAFLPECLGSIRRYASGSFEIILIDDGSPSPVILDPELDGDVTLVRQEKNLGVSAARNRGITLAQGDYICFVDSDDTLVADPHWLLENVGGHDLIAGARNDGGTPPSLLGGSRRFEGLGAHTDLIKLRFFSRFLYRRDLLLAHGIDFDTDLIVGEDELFLIKAIAHAKSVALEEYVFYEYRIWDGSTTGGPMSQKRLKARLSFLERIGAALKDHPDAALLRTLMALRWHIRVAWSADRVLGKDCCTDYLTKTHDIIAPILAGRSIDDSARRFGLTFGNRFVACLHLVTEGRIEEAYQLLMTTPPAKRRRPA